MSTFQFIRDEWRLLHRQGTVVPALLGLAILLVGATLNGRALLKVHESTSAAMRNDAVSLNEAMSAQAARGLKTATDAGAVGFSVLSGPAILHAAPLGALAVGQSDLLPSQDAVTARAEHTFLSSMELDNPLRLAIGSFDAAFVIVWLLPLFVIALNFDLVSGDRERGVLLVAAAAGVRLGSFILRKCAARACILLGGLLLALIIAGIAAGIDWRNPDALLMWTLWLATSFLYAMFWFALCLWINSVPHSSDRNAGLLAAAWLLFVVVAPALTNLAATSLFPAPSRVALTTELREATSAADRNSAQSRDRYFFDHPEMRAGEMDTGAYYRSVAESEASVAVAMRPLLEAFDAQAQRQQSVVNALQYFSPGTLAYQILTNLAGSDGRRHRDFRLQTKAFHANWTAFFVSRLNAGRPLLPTDYRSLPQFQFLDAPAMRIAADVAIPLFLLLGIVALLTWLAVRRLVRFPII